MQRGTELITRAKQSSRKINAEGEKDRLKRRRPKPGSRSEAALVKTGHPP